MPGVNSKILNAWSKFNENEFMEGGGTWDKSRCTPLKKIELII
jgi:hypothetical protein